MATSKQDSAAQAALAALQLGGSEQVRKDIGLRALNHTQAGMGVADAW